MNPNDTPSRDDLLELCVSALQRQGPARPGDTLRAWVPGRIEVLGKHTDYCGGRSLVAAVERGFCFAVRVRDDARIGVTAAASGETVEFALAADVQPRGGHWSNYLMTAARRIARNFPGRLKGADIAFASNLPPAAGLSSSSALITGMVLILLKLNDLTNRDEYRRDIHSQWDLCGYLGTVENGQSFGSLSGDKGVGTFGGSQDHTAIVCCRQGKLSRIAFNPVRLEKEIDLPKGYCFAIAASGVLAEKTGGAMHHYNNASLLVGRAMGIWRKETGRADLTLAQAIRSATGAFGRLIGLLEQEADARALVDRVTQFQRESEQIIPAASDALARGDLAEFGRQVDLSQELTETLLKNQVAQTVDLARAARRLGAVAASAFGAGFGGSVWAMIPTDQAEEFLKRWREDYRGQHAATAQRAIFFVTGAGSGATLL